MFAKEIQKITRRYALAIVSVLALVLTIAPAAMAGGWPSARFGRSPSSSVATTPAP